MLLKNNMKNNFPGNGFSDININQGKFSLKKLNINAEWDYYQCGAEEQITSELVGKTPMTLGR